MKTIILILLISAPVIFTQQNDWNKLEPVMQQLSIELAAAQREINSGKHAKTLEQINSDIAWLNNSRAVINERIAQCNNIPLPADSVAAADVQLSINTRINDIKGWYQLCADAIKNNIDIYNTETAKQKKIIYDIALFVVKSALIEYAPVLEGVLK